MSTFSLRWLARWCLGLILGLLAGLALRTSAVAQYNGPPTAADRSTSATVTTDTAVLNPTSPDTVLNVGDLVSVRLFGDPEYTASTRVGADGTVLLPLIGSVTLRGVNVRDAEQLIAQKLQTAGMYRNPQVILQITEGPAAVVTLAGEMHAVVPILGSRNLFSVLAAGGGLPSTASRTITILRPGQGQPISVDIGNDPAHSASANVPVFAGDTLIVSRIGVVYVLGEFRSPGLVPLTNYGPLTLTQVSAVVGGPLFDAKYKELHLIRTTGDRRTVTTLNIRDVLYGRVADPIMQPNDIVFLPPSVLKASVSNGSLGSILGVISFALAAVSTFR